MDCRKKFGEQEEQEESSTNQRYLWSVESLYKDSLWNKVLYRLPAWHQIPDRSGWLHDLKENSSHNSNNHTTILAFSCDDLDLKYYNIVSSMTPGGSSLPLSLLMRSACVLPLDIHAMVLDRSTPMGTATTARRRAACISPRAAPCSTGQRGAQISAAFNSITIHLSLGERNMYRTVFTISRYVARTLSSWSKK